MGFTFREDKGSDLTPEEVDNNFREVAEIKDFSTQEANRAEAARVSAETTLALVSGTIGLPPQTVAGAPLMANQSKTGIIFGDKPLSAMSTADLDVLSSGRIVVMKTPKGQATHMYRISQFNCEDIDPSGELGTGVFPAFLFNGELDSEILVGAYPAAWIDGEVVCQPGQRPATSVNFDTARQRCRALGDGWDIMSNWDWAAIALWCMANGYQPRGNTQYGRNHERRFETGTRYNGLAAGVAEGVGATLTGSGPSSWNHDNTAGGIADLVGNTWEWNSGLILRDGQFEVAPDNGTYADSEYTQTGTSAAAEGTFSTRPYTNPPEILKRCLAVPVSGLAPTGHFWRNMEGERFSLRSGTWNIGGRCGLGALILHNFRSSSGSGIGFRPRFRRR